MRFFTGSSDHSGAVSVNVPNQAVLEAQINQRWADGQGFALATLNLDHLVKLRRDPAFLAAYDAQDMVVADGNPVVWLSRLAGDPVELVPGADIVVRLAELAQAAGVSVALVGSTDNSLKCAAEALCQRVPGLEIAALIAPPMGFDPAGTAADEVFSRLQNSGARLCLVALGAPKQEIFSARGRAKTPQIGFASIGAGLDFLAGHQARAPRWVRAIAMEWLWRLLSDPRRMAMRYLLCFAILPGHMLRAMIHRNNS